MSEPNQKFEQALADLEKTVRELEDGKTSLEDALAAYERGVSLLKHCFGKLRQAELRIQQLVGIDESGAPVLAPFDHSASAK